MLSYPYISILSPSLSSSPFVPTLSSVAFVQRRWLSLVSLPTLQGSGVIKPRTNFPSMTLKEAFSHTAHFRLETASPKRLLKSLLHRSLKLRCFLSNMKVIRDLITGGIDLAYTPSCDALAGSMLWIGSSPTITWIFFYLLILLSFPST